jgi:hypothetical protein
VGRTFVAAHRYSARLFHVSIVSERALQGVHRIVSDHVRNCNDRQRAERLCKRWTRHVNEPSPTLPEAPFTKEIDPMTDDEQQNAQAIARAFETLSERLSKELQDALNQMAHLIGRAQKQQYEIMSLFGKQTAAMEALADLVAKVRHDDVERHNEHATAIEQLSQGQMKIAQFTGGLATQYGQLFKALSNRLDAVEKEAFGPNYNQLPSTPPLN